MIVVFWNYVPIVFHERDTLNMSQFWFPAKLTAPFECGYNKTLPHWSIWDPYNCFCSSYYVLFIFDTSSIYIVPTYFQIQRTAVVRQFAVMSFDRISIPDFLAKKRKEKRIMFFLMPNRCFRFWNYVPCAHCYYLNWPFQPIFYVFTYEYSTLFTYRIITYDTIFQGMYFWFLKGANMKILHTNLNLLQSKTEYCRSKMYHWAHFL